MSVIGNDFDNAIGMWRFHIHIQYFNLTREKKWESGRKGKEIIIGV